MSDAQIFQFLGLTFFSIGVGMLGNPKFIKNIAQEFKNSTVSIFYGGLMSLAIGFPLVAFHNIWISNSTVVITIVGWMALFKGLALLMFPMPTMRFYKKALKQELLMSYFVTIIGVILLYLGYLA
jgi:hypothetical protein